MPLNPTLDVEIPPAVETDILTDLENILNAINSVAIVNLSTTERQSTPSIDVTRLPYVHTAVEELGVSYPALLGPDVKQARALRLLKTAEGIRTFLIKIQEIVDRMTDLGMNCENIAYNFTLDLYQNAERYKERNVVGADTVYAQLSPLFADMGKKNPPSPAVPTP